MELIKSWSLSVISAAAISAVVMLIGPHSSNGRIIRLLAGVFVLLSFVLPLTDAQINFEEYTTSINNALQNNELEKKVEQQAAQALQTQIEAELRAYIISLGKECIDVKAKIEIDSEKNITVSEIKADISDNSKETQQKISSFSVERFGIGVVFEERTEY